MYPRLALLKEFLTDDGVIFVSIDDDEGHYLKVLLDEIFGRQNFINTVIWEKKFSPQNDAKWLSDSHDFILVFAKNKEIWRPNLLPRTSEMDSRYRNPDNDPRGVWSSSDMTVKTYSAEYDYEITTPSGRKMKPTSGRCWNTSKENFQELIKDNRIWFGENNNNVPRLKRFLTDVKSGITSMTIWKHTEVGHNQDARKEVLVFNTDDVFATPKPERLIERILILGSNPGDIVLDSFLGSGTTAAVALKMGRRFIGVEMGEHCETHCVPRLKAAIGGEQGGISQAINWKGGGGFRYCKLSVGLFDAEGKIASEARFNDLAAHVFFTETGTPLPKRTNGKTPLLGVYQGRAVYLLYNGILGDKRPNGGNILTHAIAQDLPEFDGIKIVYGEGNLLGKKALERYNIIFRHVPFELKKG
jgi:adenine-specific DNA-methyltransferase